LDRINRIIRNFFACGEGPFSRRPHSVHVFSFIRGRAKPAWHEQAGSVYVRFHPTALPAAQRGVEQVIIEDAPGVTPEDRRMFAVLTGEMTRRSVSLVGCRIFQQAISIVIIPKAPPAFNSSANDMMQGTRCIYADCAWHENLATIIEMQKKVIFSCPSPYTIYRPRASSSQWNYLSCPTKLETS